VNLMKKWQKQLLNNITTAKELVQRGLIPPEQEGKLQKVIDKYPMNITEYYLGLIEKKRLHRPYLQDERGFNS